MKFGITRAFDCSYLPDKQEQLLVYVDETNTTAINYPQLIQAGFRRSGEQIYRPYCPNCSACHAIRLPVAEFTPSRSQRRLLNKNKHFRTATSNAISADYYPLYEKYIEQRHADGTMYPPSHDQFTSFLNCQWNTPLFIEAYNGDTLIAVAVTDKIDSLIDTSSFSAMYTFFDPDYTISSLGTWMILQQIYHTHQQGREYLYLGYQIDACAKMNYKNSFYPHERYIEHEWLRYNRT